MGSQGRTLGRKIKLKKKYAFKEDAEADPERLQIPAWIRKGSRWPSPNRLSMTRASKAVLSPFPPCRVVYEIQEAQLKVKSR